jgi:thioredoxin-like negative regulator of GroEL
VNGEDPSALTRTPPLLLYFHSPRSGTCRRVDGYLAQALQRNGNHGTFVIKRIDVTSSPDLAKRFRVSAVPVICVVDNKRIVARVEVPRGVKRIHQALAPWLKTGLNGNRSEAPNAEQSGEQPPC